MIRYKCKISDKKGRITDSIRSAHSESALVKQVNDENLYLISYQEDKSRKRRRFSKKVIIDFTDTMTLMLESGLSIKDALTICGTSFKDNKTGELINTLSDSLKKGTSFPEAIDEMSSDFPPLYRGLIKIGDRTGSMDEIFSKLSKYLNDEKKMMEKIQGALMYPVFVLSILIVGFPLLGAVIFPRIRDTFTSNALDGILERFQLVMIFSIIFLVLLVSFILFILIASHSKGKYKKIADTIMLKIPLIGSINLVKSSLNVMFSLEVLTSSGYPVEAALLESSEVLTNQKLKNAILRIRRAIIGGDKLSTTFEKDDVFPSRIAVWIGIGESSGKVSRVFSQLRVYFQGELDKIASRVMVMVEPVLILFVGLLMVFFVIIFVIPLLSILGGGL